MHWIFCYEITGGVNGVIFTSARLFATGAQDGNLPSFFSLVHHKQQTPIPSLIFSVRILQYWLNLKVFVAISNQFLSRFLQFPIYSCWFRWWCCSPLTFSCWSTTLARSCGYRSLLVLPHCCGCVEQCTYLSVFYRTFRYFQEISFIFIDFYDLFLSIPGLIYHDQSEWTPLFPSFSLYSAWFWSYCLHWKLQKISLPALESP